MPLLAGRNNKSGKDQRSQETEDAETFHTKVGTIKDRQYGPNSLKIPRKGGKNTHRRTT